MFAGHGGTGAASAARERQRALGVASMQEVRPGCLYPGGTASGPRGALDFASREGPHAARPRDGRGGRGLRGGLSAGLGWEARRAAGGRVRPGTAAAATGRPPGFHWGRFGAAHALEALKSLWSGE
jgi:hypothetical protein